MSKQQTVFVRNHKKRVYNGIWFMQITEIPKKYLTQYLISGFLEFNPEVWKSVSPESDKKIDKQTEKIEYDLNEAKEYLNKHNIKFAKNMKEENIIKRALDNWWNTESVSPTIDDNDISLLDEDNDQDSDWEDLSALDD